MGYVIRAARLSAIEALLREHQVLSTADLAERTGVSAVTVRRDLDALAEMGRAERVFGGARLTGAGRQHLTSPSTPATPVVQDPENAEDEPFDQVMVRNAASKAGIGRRAAALVQDGETVFLDIGTSTYAVAEALRSRHLTVVTASLAVVDLLGAEPGISLIVLGGEYSAPYRCLQGTATVDGLAALQIDRAFLGCAGITEKGLLRDTDTRQAAIKTAAVQVAATTALVADVTKFPGIGAFTAGSVTDLDQLVTDADLATEAPALHEILTRSGTEVLTP